MDSYYDFVNNNLVAAMDPIAGRSVLEIGCASGALGEVMKRRGASCYVGVEAVPEVAERARARLDRVYVGDAEKMVITEPPRSFDYVVFGDVLEHLADPWTTLRRCATFLKPEGLVVASIPNINHASIFHGLLSGRFEYTDAGLLDRTHLRFFTLSEIGLLLERAGLACVNVTGCVVPAPELEGLAADLDALRRKHGLGGERFKAEVQTYQWMIKACLKEAAIA